MKRIIHSRINPQIPMAIFSVLGLLLAIVSVGAEVAFVSAHLDELSRDLQILTTPIIHN